MSRLTRVVDTPREHQRGIPLEPQHTHIVALAGAMPLQHTQVSSTLNVRHPGWYHALESMLLVMQGIQDLMKTALRQSSGLPYTLPLIVCRT